MPTRDHNDLHTALHEISIKLERGQSLGIVGRNGSGKSTLLQMIAGTLKPTRGVVNTHGRIASILELGVGFHPEFTGRENALMQLAMLGHPSQEAESRLKSIEDFAEIGKFFSQPTKTYSSGMLVRLAFAVIAHSDADILIVDEALAVGDAYFVQKCLRFINEFRSDGILLFVSHSTQAVRTYCDHAIWIDAGKIQLEGPSKEVTEAYIEAYFNENNDRIETSSEGEIEDDLGAISYKAPTTTIAAQQAIPLDPRGKFIDSSTLRNDIQIYPFLNRDTKEFGKRGAEIIHCAIFQKQSRSPLSWTTGGELVTVEIHVASYTKIENPVVGFFIRNSVGLEIFGDNTYITHQIERMPGVSPGSTMIAKFQFYMPILPEGDYTMTVGVGDGDEIDHLVHHWIHDAIAFRSTSSSVCTGLVGIPMQSISIETITP
ncbi:MAG: ABC transporter ATP-binding protein [Verrucomicrobiota bacterium]